MRDKDFGHNGFAGQPLVGSSKAQDMIRYPLPQFSRNIRNLGHPVRLAGKNGRLRVKSKARGK